LLEGGDLFQLIQRIGPMQVDCVRFLLSEIVSALHYLHHVVGYLHRDMKPENIMLTGDGHLKLIDFGSVAKIDGSDGVLEECPFVGTAKYLSPEMLVGGEQRGSSDVWAFGVLAYQLLTARCPFRGLGEYQTYEAIKAVQYEWVAGVDPVAMQFVDATFKPDLCERLGCKADGSSDWPELAAHGFFREASLNCFNSHRMKPPRMVANHSVAWEAAAITSPKVSLSDLESLESMSPASVNRDYDRAETERWSGHLLPNEVVVMSGQLRKHMWLHFARERRFLLLVSQQGMNQFGRMIYVDESNNTFKGEVSWTRATKARLVNSNYFDVVTPQRTFCLQDLNGRASVWVDKINSVLRQTCGG